MNTDRITQYRTYAARARTRAAIAYQAASEHSARFSGGQPILPGHHSEKGARRDRNRSDAAMRRAIQAEKAAKYWDNKTAAAQRRAAQETDPGVIQRRIARLESEQRRITRLLKDPWDEHHRAQLTWRAAEIAKELEANRDNLANTGTRVWGKHDFTKGDYALSRGTWWEIKRVNSKTVTVGAIIGSAGRRVYRLADNPYSWTDTIPYTQIVGRKAAEEIAEVEG